MATILAISSNVSYGKVGLNAYNFALQKLGHEVICIPTVNMITHPGLGKPVSYSLSGDKLADMAAELISMRVEEKLDYIISGYFNDIAQAKAVKWLVTEFKTKNPNIQYVCDPVMGDEPKGLYIKLEIADYMRDYLCPMADLISPNNFEAKYLGTLRAKKILMKAVDGNMNSYFDGINTVNSIFNPVNKHLHGAGDLFIGLFIGHILNNDQPQQALDKATQTLQKMAQYSQEHNCAQLPIVELQDEI